MLFDVVRRMRNARDDQARAALCTLDVIVDAALVESARAIAEADRTHGAHGKTIRKRQATDLDRLE